MLEVARAIGSDSRIGSKFLDSGPGFGGSCFKKDILNLVYLSKHFGLPEVAKFWEGVVDMNNWHQHRISKLIVKKLFGTVTGKKIIILGFAFKANTNDTRESAAITICQDLLEEGAVLFIHDPKVSPKQISEDLRIAESNYEDLEITNNSKNEGEWFYIDNLMESFEDSDAVVILTGGRIFQIDWQKVSKMMRKPSWIFDARSVLKPEDINDFDLNFWRVVMDRNI